MALRTIQFRLAAANTLELFSTPVNDQTLESLTLTLDEEPLEANIAYATIGVLSGGIELSHKLVTLDQGWLDRSNDLYWSGCLHLPKHSFLFAYAIADTTRTFRLTAIIWDFVPPPLREKTPGA